MNVPSVYASGHQNTENTENTENTDVISEKEKQWGIAAVIRTASIPYATDI